MTSQVSGHQLNDKSSSMAPDQIPSSHQANNQTTHHSQRVEPLFANLQQTEQGSTSEIVSYINT